MFTEKNDIKIRKIKVGITHGDINGISYEVILKAFRDHRMLEFFTPVIYGSPKVAAYYKKMLKIPQLTLNHIKSAEKADARAVNIINCVSNKVRVELGQATEVSGEAAITALQAAVRDLKEGKIDVLVTAPISKEAVYGEKFNFKGHTWYLANEFGAEDVLMLMVHEDLRIAVATDHIPLKDVSAALTEELILSKLRLLNESLKTDFAVDGPLIAVLGLNPHSGDGGLIGDEEEKVIIPAIEKAKDEGINVLGPYPADGFFASGNYRNFDGILAMYHDQGLIPFKVLSQGQGVNYTAGLPVIRTSPDHGVAYDIVGLNKADATSFVNALFLARTIYKNRELLGDIEPLEKQNMEELIHTLKPAKTAELQEIETIQKEDKADEVKPDKSESISEKKIATSVESEQETDSPAEENQEVTIEEEDVHLPGDEDVVTDTTHEMEIDEPMGQDQTAQEGNNHDNDNKRKHKPFQRRRRENFRDYSDLT